MNAPGSAGAAKTVSLDQVSPPRLFFALLHQRFTGAMTLAQPAPNPATRTVWFDGGMPVFTDWVENTDVLGQVLMELGLLGQEQLLAALEAMANGGGLLGEQLIKQGIINPAALGEGLRKQCFRKLIHLFGLRTGQVTVMTSDQDVGKLGKVNVLELIGIGVGAHYDLSRIEAELGPSLHGPVQATAALTRYRSHFRFRPTDEPLLGALLQGTSFDELVNTGAPALRTGQLIYLLWACQMLRMGMAASPRASAPAAAPQAAAPQAAAPQAAAPQAAAPQAAPQAAAPRKAAPRKAAPRKAAPTAPAQSATRQPARPEPAPPPFGSRDPVPRAVDRARSAPPPPARPTAFRPVQPKAASAPPAAKTARPNASPVELELLTELEMLEEKIARKAHAFDLLGVPLTAGRKEIRRAWADLSKRLHPDGLQAKGLTHLRDRVNDVFAALSEAQGLLGDKDKRAELKDAIERGDDPADRADAAAQARAVFESEMIAKEADKLLKIGRFADAQAKYAEALELAPDEHDLRAAAAWCVYNVSSKQRQDAAAVEQILSEIVRETPRIARAHYFRGHVLRDMGAIEAAIISFEEAHANDTRLIDAERQARALRVSQGRSASANSGPKKKRGLKGLFSKS